MHPRSSSWRGTSLPSPYLGDSSGFLRKESSQAPGLLSVRYLQLGHPQSVCSSETVKSYYIH
jgi:hypothetical protein